jgi:regulatory protein
LFKFVALNLICYFAFDSPYKNSPKNTFMPSPKTRPTLEQARLKAEKYCAYQERSQQEVKRKLLSMGLSGNEADEIMVQLIGSNFLNEERFARAYSQGKHRAKQWGLRKIQHQLKAKGVSEKLSKQVLSEIDSKEYLKNLKNLLEKKNRNLKEPDLWKRSAKLKSYLIGKGYETELVISEVEKYLNKSGKDHL